MELAKTTQKLKTKETCPHRLDFVDELWDSGRRTGIEVAGNELPAEMRHPCLHQTNNPQKMKCNAEKMS